MTVHKVSEDWLLELETTLGAVTLKDDRLGERLNKILAEASFLRQKALKRRYVDLSAHFKDSGKIRNSIILAVSRLKCLCR